MKVNKLQLINEALKQQYELSDRETEVLHLLIQGLSNNEIGDKLYLSTKTIKNYVSAIYDKTCIPTRYKLQGKVTDMLCTPTWE